MARGPSGRRAEGTPSHKDSWRLTTPMRPDAWAGTFQPKDTYLSTVELAARLRAWAGTHAIGSANSDIVYQTVHNWCRRDWFGPLPPERKGRSHGYRIPPHYEYVGRVWMLTQDEHVREVAQQLITPESARDWLVVVANVGSLHYSQEETEQRIAAVLRQVLLRSAPLHVLYIGPNIRPSTKES